MVLDLRASEVDKVRIDTVTMIAEARDGLLTVDTLMLRIGGAVGTGAGTFGLRSDRRGELTLALAIDSLHRLRPYLPGDSALIAPTQSAIARSLRRQRADSLALARRTEVERAARGLAPIALKVIPPEAVRGDSLSGQAALTVRLQGWLRDVSGSGVLDGKDLFVNGNSAQVRSLTPTWSHIVTDTSSARVAGSSSGMSVSGFNIDSLGVGAEYRWQKQHTRDRRRRAGD